MFTFSGYTAKQAKDRLKESRELWPQGFIKFEFNIEKLIQNFRSNHRHICFGNCLNTIEEFVV